MSGGHNISAERPAGRGTRARDLARRGGLRLLAALWVDALVSYIILCAGLSVALVLALSLSLHVSPLWPAPFGVPGVCAAYFLGRRALRLPVELWKAGAPSGPVAADRSRSAPPAPASS